MILRLAIIGFGNVAQEFSRLLLSKREWLVRTKGLDMEVFAVATRTRGSLLSRRALDLERILRISQGGGSLEAYGPEISDLSATEIIKNCESDIVVELTTLNINSGQPAIDHIRTALEMGINVVTANKGPLAFAYTDLRDLAEEKRVQLRFEGTVMDGTPIFSLVERTLPGCLVKGITGTLNSTSNFVLTRMSMGKTMEEALGEAKKLGITEADPSMDVDGWDAAAKITVLANVLMNAKSNPKRVDRRGIRSITTEDVRKATETGKKIKLIARAQLQNGLIKTAVRPELIGTDSPFWSVDGTSGAITLSTDLMNEITIIENNPTIAQTAYAILSDILLVAETL